MSNRLRRSLIAVASVCFLGIGTVQAQPTNKPIRLIVPYAAGGPIDVTARALAERVKDTLGTVIIENRPGAGGNIGADTVAKATPDGSIIGIAATATHAVNPWLPTTHRQTLLPSRKYCVYPTCW
jgi:tripartite-type tricarboxylate transporter receptor subunit TctC